MKFCAVEGWATVLSTRKETTCEPIVRERCAQNGSGNSGARAVTFRALTATGTTGTHHHTFELVLADGRHLRTRVSHLPDRTDCGKQIWAHILRDQLCVTAKEFWVCADRGIVPARGRVADTGREQIPAEVVAMLIRTVGLSDAEVRSMTRAEAISRLNQHWTQSEPDTL